MTAGRFDALSVMVVDDEPGARGLVSRMLSRLGVTRIALADGGTAALAALVASAAALPDLVICDLQMPDGDGAGLMHGIATLPAPPKVILMSGAGPAALDSVARIAAGLGLSVVATLSKPIAPSALGAALDDAVTGRTSPLGRDERAVSQARIAAFAHSAAGPLMTVAMLTELLLEDGALSQAQADDLRQIRRAGEELSRMIKELGASS